MKHLICQSVLKSVITTVVAGLCVSLSVAQAADEPLSLLMQGTFHGDEISVMGDHVDVMSLMKKGAGIFLEPETLRVTKVKDEVIDIGNVETGKEVTRIIGEMNNEPIVMIHPATLKPGIVPEAKDKMACLKHFHDDTATPEHDAQGQTIMKTIDLAIYNGEPCTLELGSEIYQFHLDATRQTDDTYPAYVVDMTVTHNGVAQKIEGVAQILFAGDLDRDGKLDLLIDRTDHYNVWAHKVLYLSSGAKKDEVMGRIASLMAVGC